MGTIIRNKLNINNWYVFTILAIEGYMIYKLLKTSSIYTLILVLASSCSLTKSGEENETLKNTISQVVIQYLQFSFLSRIEPLESIVIMKDFLRNQEITIDEYQYRVVRLSRRWPIEENPLIQLGVKEVVLDGDNASATLQRMGSGFPELNFKLLWTGSSWVVVDDNIFGKGELYEEGS